MYILRRCNGNKRWQAKQHCTKPWKISSALRSQIGGLSSCRAQVYICNPEMNRNILILDQIKDIPWDKNEGWVLICASFWIKQEVSRCYSSHRLVQPQPYYATQIYKSTNTEHKYKIQIQYAIYQTAWSNPAMYCNPNISYIPPPLDLIIDKNPFKFLIISHIVLSSDVVLVSFQFPFLVFDQVCRREFLMKIAKFGAEEHISRLSSSARILKKKLCNFHRAGVGKENQVFVTKYSTLKYKWLMSQSSRVPVFTRFDQKFKIRLTVLCQKYATDLIHSEVVLLGNSSHLFNSSHS